MPAYHCRVEVLAVATAYVMGMLPTAQLVGRRVGRDPTREGSGNPGASNVYRTAGAKAGATVFAGDFLKGAAATGLGWAVDSRVLGVVCGIAAVSGHVAPAARRFRGGKGVATAAGVVAVLFPLLAAGVAIGWAAVARVSGRASLASIVAVIAATVTLALTETPAEELAGFALLAGIIVLRHAGNISRLVRGEERRLRDVG